MGAELDRDSLEYKLAILLICSIGADGLLDEKELDIILDFFSEELGKNSRDEINEFLEECFFDMDEMGDDAFSEIVWGAIDFLGANLDSEQAAQVVKTMERIANDSNMPHDEREFIQMVKREWNLN